MLLAILLLIFLGGPFLIQVKMCKKRFSAKEPGTVRVLLQ
jgi:hypothetical protein